MCFLPVHYFFSLRSRPLLPCWGLAHVSHFLSIRHGLTLFRRLKSENLKTLSHHRTLPVISYRSTILKAAPKLKYIQCMKHTHSESENTAQFSNTHTLIYSQLSCCGGSRSSSLDLTWLELSLDGWIAATLLLPLPSHTHNCTYSILLLYTETTTTTTALLSFSCWYYVSYAILLFSCY